jgi:CHAD domain-containing protein
MSQRVTTDLGGGPRGETGAKGSPQLAEVSELRVKPRDPAGEAVAQALRTALSRIATNEPEARRGEPEGVHRLRSASRRLRSELRALKDLVDQKWRSKLEIELKWLAGLLGDVRDLDILLSRLRAVAVEVERPEVERVAFEPLLEGLQRRRAQAVKTMFDVLKSERYRALLKALEHAAEHPPLEEAAGEACRVALPPAVKAAWRRLKKAARDLRDDTADEKFHEARKRAKSARYTAELIAPLLGRRAAHGAGEFIRRTTRLQDALGEHQDALITLGELESAVAGGAGDSAMVERAATMVEDQRKRAGAARARFFKIWTGLDRKKLRRWMKPRRRAEAHGVAGGRS